MVRILVVSQVQALVALVQALVDLVQALVALFQAHVDLVQALVALVQADPTSGRIDMVGKEAGCSGARIWVG